MNFHNVLIICLVDVLLRVSYTIFLSLLLQEKFGSAWTFVATTFLNEYDKNCYEVIILFCIDFLLTIYCFPYAYIAYLQY